MAVSEMVTSRAELRHSNKTRFRSDFIGEPEPVTVQIVGTDPTMLAAAAQYNVRNGAQIIDINMGCPAKKVCKKAAGSALLADQPLVEKILTTVVKAVTVPVTVKIRTGSSPNERNAVEIAKIAENAGVKSITVHGRTRACKFVGAVEYDTIAEVKNAVTIPVVANGDIDTPQTALRVIEYTGADAIMVGRAAQGQPWLFGQIASFLGSGKIISKPSAEVRALIITDHIKKIHQFYGDFLGVRLARKHIKWYLQYWGADISDQQRTHINTTENPRQQLQLLTQFLNYSMPALAA